MKEPKCLRKTVIAKNFKEQCLLNLSVGITDADIHSNHEEDGDRDTEISNHPTDLVVNRVLTISKILYLLVIFCYTLP